MLAGAVLSRADPSRRDDPDAIYGAVRAGLAVLYLHEAFHHKAESFAIRLEIVEHDRRLRPAPLSADKMHYVKLNVERR